MELTTFDAIVVVIVFCCSLLALNDSPLRELRFPLAICVALLSMLGLQEAMNVWSVQGGSFNVALMSEYAALGVTFIVVVILIILSKIVSWIQKWRSMRRTPRPPIRERQSVDGRSRSSRSVRRDQRELKH